MMLKEETGYLEFSGFMPKYLSSHQIASLSTLVFIIYRLRRTFLYIASNVVTPVDPNQKIHPPAAVLKVAVLLLNTQNP